MIIINSNDTDQSTNDIIDWLKYSGADFKRINFSDQLLVKNLELNEGLKFDLEFTDNGEVIKLSDINFFWYRRGDLDYSFQSPSMFSNVIIEDNNSHQWALIFEQLEAVCCKHVQVRFYNIDGFFTFLEFLKDNHNIYFNRKVCIDENGNLKMSTTSDEDFGNIASMSLKSLYQNEVFKGFWEVSKDKMEKCKDCELILTAPFSHSKSFYNHP